MTLRDLLLRDFGKELPISEGWGKKDDPIVITVQDSQEVSRTELEVIRYIAKVHGWIWRRVGHDVFADEDGRIEKIYIDGFSDGEEGKIYLNKLLTLFSCLNYNSP